MSMVSRKSRSRYQTRSALAADALGAAMRAPEIATRAAVMSVANRDLFESRVMGWRVGGGRYPQVDFGAIRSVPGVLASRHWNGNHGRFDWRWAWYAKCYIAAHGSGASWSARFAAERFGGR